MKYSISTLLLIILFVFGAFRLSNNKNISSPLSGNIDSVKSLYLADPTIFYDKGTYYLYGTHAVNQGFTVYTSKDSKQWSGPAGVNDGLALRKEDVYGTSGFWAPQVFRYNGKYYMAYTANEHIAIAESNNPLGPFKQEIKKPISAGVKTIDPFVFIDNDGNKYLYHVRLDSGNRLFVSALNDKLTDIKANTTSPCINAVNHPQAWENTADKEWTVTEGPTVLKHKGIYYLFYSANDFRNIDYAVGYATAKNPRGPWKKYKGNPVLSKDLIGHNGTGHGDFFQNRQGQYYYVFHTHYSDAKVSPRETAIIKGDFVPGNNDIDIMKFQKASFYYLKEK